MPRPKGKHATTKPFTTWVKVEERDGSIGGYVRRHWPAPSARKGARWHEWKAISRGIRRFFEKL